MKIKQIISLIITLVIILSFIVSCSKIDKDKFSESSKDISDISEISLQESISSSSNNSSLTNDLILYESSRFILPKIYSNFCVLQQNSTINIYGKFDADEKLTLIFNGKEYYNECKNGKFSFEIKTPAASKKSYEIIIHNGYYKKTIKHVAIGEVFLMGGQSNMVFSNSELKPQPPEASDGGNEWIRFTCTVPIAERVESPIEDYQGTWLPTNNGTFPGMSAFCNYFGRKMFKELDIPIGLIHCAISDSSLAPWLTEDDAKKLDNENTTVSTPYYTHTPGQFYNYILYPYLNYVFKGVVWYQGESSTPSTYEKNLETFIKSWRKYFKKPNLPFIIIQLPGYDTSIDWPATREAQKNVCNKLENCAYTVNIDLGEKGNIHPQDKKPAAERAASAMLNLVFNKNEPKPALFKSVTKQGSNIVLKFNNASNMRLANSSATGIEISTNGQTWTPVSSNQITVNGDTVTISNVSSATQIRYAWASWPSVSLFNGNGLPAEPFRATL